MVEGVVSLGVGFLGMSDTKLISEPINQNKKQKMCFCFDINKKKITRIRKSSNLGQIFIRVSIVITSFFLGKKLIISET